MKSGTRDAPPTRALEKPHPQTRNDTNRCHRCTVIVAVSSRARAELLLLLFSPESAVRIHVACEILRLGGPTGTREYKTYRRDGSRGQIVAGGRAEFEYAAAAAATVNRVLTSGKGSRGKVFGRATRGGRTAFLQISILTTERDPSFFTSSARRITSNGLSRLSARVRLTTVRAWRYRPVKYIARPRAVVVCADFSRMLVSTSSWPCHRRPDPHGCWRRKTPFARKMTYLFSSQSKAILLSWFPYQWF